MLFFDVFQNNFQILLAVAAFLVLFSALRRTRLLEQNKAFALVSTALTIFFGTSALQYFSSFFYANGVPFKIFLLAEILLILAASLLLLMSACKLLLQKFPGLVFSFSFITIGLCASLYIIFIADNASWLRHIRHILPIICLTCVCLAFLAQTHFGYITAGVSLAGMIGLILSPLLGISSYPWFLPVDLILLLALSFYMIYTENLDLRFNLLAEKQRQTVSDIENIVKSSPFPIVITHLNDDRLILANRNAVKMFDLNEDEITRYRFKDFFVDEDNLHVFLNQLAQNQNVQNFEILVQAAGGKTPFWLLISANVIDLDNNVVLYAAFQDITDRKRRENLLQTQANRDPLTSLFNRRYFEDNLPEKITQAHRRGQSFAIIMLDADKFKNVNDTYGHKVGDKVLMELAAVCERQLRAEDLVARYGGEEFVIFLNNVNTETASSVANRLREAIADSVVYAENHDPVKFSVSIGIAPSGISDSPDALIKMADDAMYLAKQNGRNRIEVYSLENIEKAKKNQKSDKARTKQIHPVYEHEEDEEISLLDGPESTHILED
jgi:diguanylate cyclase (GGDEF)-like protein/PAS domain S-box-containing protein